MIYIPSKIFPCDCMGEGITVTQFYDEDDISEGEVKVSEDIWQRRFGEAPYIQLSFWEFGHSKQGRWSWWWRLKIAYSVFKNKGPWPDMVCMKAAVAKNLANHILYMISKADKEIKLEEKQPPLEAVVSTSLTDRGGSCEGFTEPSPEELHPMHCVMHGGGPGCEAYNKKNGFKCPKCTIEDFGLDQ